MWRDYFGSVGTILAVVNGLIAITIALLPMRRSVHKLRLGALALVLGGLAVGAAFYTTYRSYAQTERQQTDRAEIRLRLAAFIVEGRELLGQIRDDRREMPTAAADQWAQRAEIYLRDRVGERYVTRFRANVQRALRRRRRGYRIAAGLLARGAQPHRQPGSDQRRISRAALAASGAAQIKRAAQRPPFRFHCRKISIPRRAAPRARRRGPRRPPSARTWRSSSGTCRRACARFRRTPSCRPRSDPD